MGNDHRPKKLLIVTKIIHVNQNQQLKFPFNEDGVKYKHFVILSIIINSYDLI